MKSTKRGFVIPIIPIALGLLALLIGYGIYSSFAGPRKDAETRAREAKIKSDLNLAQAKYEWETAKLNNLYVAAADTNPYFTAIQAQFSTAQSAVESTNIFFKNPESSSPAVTLKVSTVELAKDIKEKRVIINELLVNWKEKTEILMQKKVDANTLAVVMEDAKIIEAYIAELAQVVNGLTPENSSLTQSQIDSYQAIVTNATQEINIVTNALENAVVVVTPEQIQNQTDIVAQAQADAAALQAQLDLIQSQNQIPPNPAPISPIDTPVVPPVVPDPTPIIEPPIVIPPAPEPIIIPTTTKPVKPKLIQGANL